MLLSFESCKPKGAGNAVSGNAAEKTYVAPGKYDEFYNFASGGFSGQLSVYGLPSGRLLRVIPVFSLDPEKGWGFSEETKPMLKLLMVMCLGMICTTFNYQKPMVTMMVVGYLPMPITPLGLRVLTEPLLERRRF